MLALLWMAFPAISAAAPSQPEASLKSMSLAELGNIEVTSTSKQPEQVWKTPAAVYVLTSEDIHRSGATSIPEALRLVPGVQVSRIDEDHWAIGIRGFADQFSKSMLVLVDGRSLYTPLFAGVYWALQDGVMLEDVDRIEVIRGPGGTIWGANAVNGVINIITKSAKETHGVHSSVGGGNVDQGIGAARFGAGYGQNFDYRIYGKGFVRGPGYHPDNAAFDSWRSLQGGFRSDWQIKGRDQFTIQGDMYKGGVGQRVGWGSFNPPEQVISDKLVEVSGGNLLGHWRRQLGEGSDLQVQFYYDRTFADAPHYQETRNTFDLDFVHHLTLPRQNFLWGAGARFSPSDFVQTVPTLNFTPHHIDNNVYSGFIQDEFAIVPNRFSITLGSKLGHNNYTGFEFQPSIRGLWAITPRQSLWAAVTRAVRAPSRIEEDFQLTDFLLAVPPIYLAIDGNRNLSSERLLGYEAGYRALLTPTLYLDFAAFHNDYNDLVDLGAQTLTLDLAPIPHFTVHFPWANGIAGNTDGFEIAPDWKPSRWWQMKAAYSYINLDLHNKAGNLDAGSVSTDEGSSPHNQV
ncbi:MAG TPA: TonB-dependent receptor plug domain-containing protein, partial [Terriglobales bacterium]